MAIDPQRLAFVMQRMQLAPQAAPQTANMPPQAFGGRVPQMPLQAFGGQLPAQAASMAGQSVPVAVSRPMMPPVNMAVGRMPPR